MTTTTEKSYPDYREKLRKLQSKHSKLQTELARSIDQTRGAWFNRDRFCAAINVIGKEIVGPRIDSFKGDCCSEDAVVRETRKLIEKLEAENADLRRALDSANDKEQTPT